MDVAEIMKDEIQLKLTKVGIKCSRCDMIGHNKDTCEFLVTQETS